MDDVRPEARQALRQKTFLQGKLYFNNRLTVCECLIRELSDGGARLAVSDSVALPDELELYIPTKDQTLRISIVWRRGEEVGVAFVQESSAHVALDVPTRLARLEEEVADLRRIIKKLKAESGPQSEVA